MYAARPQRGCQTHQRGLIILSNLSARGGGGDGTPQGREHARRTSMSVARARHTTILTHAASTDNRQNVEREIQNAQKSEKIYEEIQNPVR